MTRAHVKLLGPCFKTDRMEQGTDTAFDDISGRIHLWQCPAPKGVPRSKYISHGCHSRQITGEAGPRKTAKVISTTPTSSRVTRPNNNPLQWRKGRVTVWPWGCLLQQMRPPREAARHQPHQPHSHAQSAPESTASSIRLPPNNFTHSWTLSSKFFSTFPHGTCSLSVSQAYLALDGAYHPFRVALTSNSTPGRHQLTTSIRTRAYHPLRERAAFQRTWRTENRQKDGAPKHHIPRHPKNVRFGAGLGPCSLAVTGGILFSFFSSAKWYA